MAEASAAPTGETSLAESEPVRTSAEIVRSLVSTGSLTNDALVATEREIAMLSTRPEMTEDEKAILQAVLEAVQTELAQRMA